MSEDKKKDVKKEAVEHLAQELSEKGLYLSEEEIACVLDAVHADVKSILNTLDEWSQFFQDPAIMTNLATSSIDIVQLTSGIQQILNIQQGIIQVGQWYSSIKLELGARPKILSIMDAKPDIVV